MTTQSPCWRPHRNASQAERQGEGRGSQAEVEDSRVDRSFAARAPIGRLARPLTFALPRGATAKRLGIAFAALALLGGGWLWLRDSPLVSVEHVQIAGVQGPDAAGIDAALSAAAQRMSTLDVNVGALRAAVAPFRVVRGLSVSTSFPHGLRIRVIEQPPVAALTVAGVRTAVAADGVVLGPGLLSRLAAGAHRRRFAAALRARPGRDCARRAERAGRRSADAARLGRARLRGPRRAHRGDARRAAALLRRRHTPARQVALGRACARRPVLRGGDATSTCALPNGPRRAPRRPAACRGAPRPGAVSASDPTSAALARTLEEAVAGDSGVNTSSAAASAPASSSPAAAGATQGSAATAGAQEAAQAASPTTPQEAAPTAPQATPQEAPSATSAEPSPSTSG